MSKYRVVLTDQVFPDVTIERQILEEAGADLEVAGGGREEVLALARDADGLLNTYFPLDAADLAGLTRCRVVARYGIGVDNVDLGAAHSHGIVVTNVPDYCVEEVATHATAMILAIVRRLPEANRQILGGSWGIGGLRPIPRLSECQAGLVGYGRIARALAARLRAFGMHILTYDPYLPADADVDAERVGLEELLERSDVVSLHCPLTDDTRGLIGTAQIEMMKPTAVLVNTSRGPLVRFDDLAEALRAARIAGAGLDVFEHEPPPPASLEGVPNLLATPHSAFYSEASLRESQRKAATQVARVLRGEAPDYPVTPPPAG